MSATAALIGGAVSAASALLGTHMKNEAQKRESELAYQRQKAAIKEQNAYNSPSAQMARLQAAGLNPNLMYEQSKETAAGLQSDIPEYQPAPIDNAFGQIGSMGSEVIQSMIGLKDLENKTDLAAADIALKSYQGLREVSQANVNSETVRILAQQWGFNEAMNPLLLSKTQGEIIKLEYDVKSIQKSFELTDAQIENLAADTNLKEGELYRMLTLLQPEVDKIREEIRTMVTQQGLNGANAQLAFQQSKYFREKTWEVAQRYYLDKWNIEQNLNIAEKNYLLEADKLGEQVREFDRTNAREWVKYGTDTFFKVADLVLELIPYLMKGAKIGF